MAENDRLALDAAIKRSHQERAPERPTDEYFELLAGEQVLKDYQLTDDQIDSGIVDGYDDGGVDAIYFFINRELVTDDLDVEPSEVTRAELFIIQATEQTKFQVKRVNDLALFSEDLLKLARDEKELAGTYNPELLEAIARFKTQYRRIHYVEHDFKIMYFYVSRGDTDVINAGMQKAAKRVTDTAREIFPNRSCEFEFLGAAELLSRIQRRPSRRLPLNLTVGPLAVRGQDAYVCLVSLEEYFNFIVDDNGDQREDLYQSNVRHFQGDNQVNRDIAATLREGPDDEDFWWLNNGITILCTQANPSGGFSLVIDDPQIVNGLQTSRKIYDHFRSPGVRSGEKRNVLIRVIARGDTESQVRIIRATNSQNRMLPHQLHALEPIERQIEQHFPAYDLFYDRQGRFYKNQGKPIAKIVERIFLTQAVLAAVLRQPDHARARPSTYLKNNYDKVFCEKYPLPIFAKCAIVAKGVESYLRTPQLGIERHHRVNLRWYVVMEYVQSLTGSNEPTPQQVAEIEVPQGDDSKLVAAYHRVRGHYDRLGATDVIAKGTALLTALTNGEAES